MTSYTYYDDVSYMYFMRYLSTFDIYAVHIVEKPPLKNAINKRKRHLCCLYIHQKCEIDRSVKKGCGPSDEGRGYVIPESVFLSRESTRVPRSAPSNKNINRKND